MTLATIPRYDSERITESEDRAVVVGASIAGMLAARVLADRYESVTIIERDSLPDEPVPRRSVPQARQPHGLLEGGRATIEDLFPGYGEELVAEGGLVIDAASDVEFYAEEGFLAKGSAYKPMYCASRSLFEFVMRRRIAEVDGIELRTPCQFIDYLADDTRVKGVVVRDEMGTTVEIPAALVVDATGRISRTPAWLEAHGYTRPALEEVRIDVGYGTVEVERPAADERAILVPAAHPNTRGSVVVPIEDDRWVVTLHGYHGDHPPKEASALREFAEHLSTPIVSDLLDVHSLSSETVHYYPIPTSRRLRYEKLDRFPDGLLVIGDAIANFNPIYAQGMSVAALEALALHHVLAEGDDELAHRFFEETTEIIDIAWGMSVGGDFGFPETEGPKPRGTAVIGWYLSRLTRRAHGDGELSDALGQVIRLEQPPKTLFRPGVLWRVFKPNIRSRAVHGRETQSQPTE